MYDIAQSIFEVEYKIGVFHNLLREIRRGGTVQENGFNVVISDDFSKMFQNATKLLLGLSDNDGA